MGLNSLLLSRARANHHIVIPPIADVWTTGGNMTYSAYNQGQAGGGAGVVWAGSNDSYFHTTTNTYSAGVFSSAASLSCGVNAPASCGSESDAISVGGQLWDPYTQHSAKVSVFNGSTWSSGADCSYSFLGAGGAGASSSAALVFGGYNYSIYLKTTVSYNGTSWSSETMFGTDAAKAMLSCGTLSAALKAGGDTGSSVISASETFNGSSWSAGVSYPANISAGGCVGGTSNSLCFTGDGGSGGIKNTYHFNGTTWSSRANAGVARFNIRGFGMPINAVAAGGYVSGGPVNSSEYYS